MSASAALNRQPISSFAPSGTYVMAKYVRETCDNLHRWAGENGIPKPLDRDKIHSTIVQSHVPIVEFERLNREVDGVAFFAKKFMMVSTRFKSLSGEPEGALIVLLDAPELEELHQELLTNGARHTRSSYEPHVTVSYFVPKSIDLDVLPLPTFKFIVSKIVAEPIDIDWMVR